MKTESTEHYSLIFPDSVVNQITEVLCAILIFQYVLNMIPRSPEEVVIVFNWISSVEKSPL